MDDLKKEEIKQTFLAIIKWCSTHTGARVVFDLDEECPHANVEDKIIHMPTKVFVSKTDYTLGIIIHEAMHIKHTPKWLGELCRDRTDKAIFNALEDRRIEEFACKQLRALPFFLNKAVEEVKKHVDKDKVPLGFKVLANISCAASGSFVFRDPETDIAEGKNEQLHDDLLDIFKRIFTVSMAKSFEANVAELHKKIDEFRKLYKLPDINPKEKEEMEQEAIQGMKAVGGPGQSYVRQEDTDNKPGKKGHKIDLSDINPYLINLNEQAKERLKETLKKTLTTIIDEGNCLNTDNLTAIFTGDIDELFFDTKSEKKMRTKLYFLMDCSGSMNNEMCTMTSETVIRQMKKEAYEVAPYEVYEDTNTGHRQELAIASFKAISEVIDECRDVYGTDIEYDNYMFDDCCKKVKTMSTQTQEVGGGGTNLLCAMETVFEDIHLDDPANKRILVVLTDGDVGNTEDIKRLIIKEAQDIRVVFVGITNGPSCDLIKHNIVHTNHGEAMIVEAMETAL